MGGMEVNEDRRWLVVRREPRVVTRIVRGRLVTRWLVVKVEMGGMVKGELVMEAMTGGKVAESMCRGRERRSVGGL